MIEYSIILCAPVAVIKSSKKKATRFSRSGLRRIPEKLQPLFQDRGRFEAYRTARLDANCSASLWVYPFTGFACANCECSEAGNLKPLALFDRFADVFKRRVYGIPGRKLADVGALGDRFD
jgi:hypothetical protein